MKSFQEIIANTEWGPKALAERITAISSERVSPQAISQWDKVPARRVLEVEEITGISRHVLRPDVFGEGSKPKKRAS